MIQELFGNKVKQLRVQKGMSQDDLSALSGIDRPQISKIEQGKINATLETIEKIAIALNANTSELLDNKVSSSSFCKVGWWKDSAS